MILVYLTVNGGLSLLMTLLDYLLVYNSGSDLFVDCGIMVASFLPGLKVTDEHNIPK